MSIFGTENESAAGLSRRTFVGGAVAVAGSLALAACTGKASPGASVSGSASTGSTSLTSSLSTEGPKAGIAAMLAGYEAQIKNQVKLDIIPGASFSETIASYLSGSPADTFTWFGGYRMKYYASQGLLASTDDLWESLGSTFSAGAADASTGDDGKKYLIPNYTYPWAVFYRKSVWKKFGYTEPETWDQLLALCAQMKKHGLTPISLADKDSWPAMGTFDIINLRLNGHEFHLNLCAHKESWDQPKVQSVFDQWSQLTPYQPAAAQVLGATWQDGVTSLANGKAGMYVFGSFLTQAITDKSISEDIDFFPFPEIAVEGRDAIEAPLDGFLLTKRGGDNPVARDLLKYLGGADAQTLYYSKDPNNIQTSKGFDTSKYSAFNQKAAKLISEAKYQTQFFDRDALPAMATNVLAPALQQFLKSGSVDLKNIERQAKTLYASQ